MNDTTYVRQNSQEYRQDTEAALRSLDEQTIRDYAARWNRSLPEDATEFWTAVHNARLSGTYGEFSEEELAVSREWLENNADQ